MVLQDHFRPPLSLRRHWHAFHNAWATYIAADLNQHLPEGYFAEPNVQFGIEIDVATFEESGPLGAEDAASGVSRAPLTTGNDMGWVLPAPTQTLPLALMEETVEVLVFQHTAGPTLAAALELVSPANKDRPAHRTAFVSKCAAYIQQGIGLMIIDVVTERQGNLHNALLTRLCRSRLEPWQVELYVASYRPVQRAAQPSLDVWQAPLALGHALPTMPLWLQGHLCVPVSLDTTYERTCREQRLLPPSR
ncbi:MAG: DUF4058 family protein [Candidatus Tectomicrobia bacterium]|uniref:DUF4058 family protein n=1 Tax=Tectimicrobiota bacterium TaxID=2528274 RepID=A0A937W0J0_UNCTE|nr:DUF4058 family protein [Candidatus Tectomicrobia bacterium]